MEPKFTYKTLGGRIGDVEVTTDGPQMSFTPGGEVVLFFGPEIASDGYPILDDQHIYRVETSRSGVRTVDPEPTGLPLVDAPASGQRAHGPVRLDSFVAALKKSK